MPGTMTEKENLLSLVSIEVLINNVQMELNIECHLPCIVFRLLDYPAVSIPYFDQWQIEEFHNLKKDHPNLSWRQLLSDQFYELRSANGKFQFKRGKSCLFKTYFKTLYNHLLNVPLFILLVDQIHNNTSNFIGSCNIKLNELIEILNQSIIKHGYDIPLVEQQTFYCTLFNLMGTKIGTCDIAVRFCHYGTTILTHLPMLDNSTTTASKTEKKSPVIKEQVSQPPPTDTIVKHIHFINEKKDVGLQISRSDLPLSSTNNKSAQTRWTSTKTRSNESHHHYLRTIEDPSMDDPTIAFYRPPALYFNSDSDFLQMMTPTTTTVVQERLSYLASIPIESFDNEPIIENEKQQQQQPKRKSISNVRFNLPSTTTKVIPTQKGLAKDFLHNFPLLRSLVEEALAIQAYQGDIPISIQHKRPQSAVEQRQINIKPTGTRPKTATNIRTKSVIINNTRRLYPTPMKTNRTTVTKNEVRNLVDRLSKPRLNKHVKREIPHQEPPKISPRILSKPVSISSPKTTKKPTPSYRTTRAHRLMTEFSQARRAGVSPKKTTNSSRKSQTPPRQESTPNIRISPPSPQIQNIGRVSQLSLLNKVDVDSTFGEKNKVQPSLSEKIPIDTSITIKSTSSTSQDVTFKLNQTITKAITSTPEPKIRQNSEGLNEKYDDLSFSISDVTDYFTDGESSTHPPTEQ